MQIIQLFYTSYTSINKDKNNHYKLHSRTKYHKSFTTDSNLVFLNTIKFITYIIFYKNNLLKV